MNHPQGIAAALVELNQKSITQIQAETAYTWAYRAAAAWRMQNTADAVEYQHEAIEHAALTGDDTLLDEVRQICHG